MLDEAKFVKFNLKDLIFVEVICIFHVLEVVLLSFIPKALAIVLCLSPVT